MYAFPNDNQILVVISATFVFGEFMVTMDVSQGFKYLSGNGALSILCAKER